MTGYQRHSPPLLQAGQLGRLGLAQGWLAGQLAESFGLRSVFVVVAMNFCIIAALDRAAERRAS